MHRTPTLDVCTIAALVAPACSSSSTAVSSSTVAPTGSTAASSTAAAPGSGLPDVNQNFTASAAPTASAPGITPTTIKLGYISSAPS